MTSTDSAPKPADAKRVRPFAERAILLRMWEDGKPQPDGSRLTRIGAAELAEKAAMSRSTALRAVRALEAKYKIELVEPHEPIVSRPRIYRVKPWGEVVAEGRQTEEQKPLSADQISEMAARGENISRFFTNKGKMMPPVRRVNVDFAEPMLNELDEAARQLNISRQAVIKTLIRQALDQQRLARRTR